MRTIGMIGTTSRESSAIYHKMLTEPLFERLGGHHSAETMMYSFDLDRRQKFAACLRRRSLPQFAYSS
jgi:aspartate racemase